MPNYQPRRCTHVKTNGVRCGSPALKDQYFCYFHTNLIKGVPGRVDARFSRIATLDNPDSVQFAIMDLMQDIYTGAIEPKRASLMIKLITLAIRNLKNLTFDKPEIQQQSVTEVPNYPIQYLREHPECGEPRNGWPDDETACDLNAIPDPPTTNTVQHEALALDEIRVTNVDTPPKFPPETVPLSTSAPQARESAAHGVSRGSERNMTEPRSGERTISPENQRRLDDINAALAEIPENIERNPAHSDAEHAEAVRQHKDDLADLKRAAAALPGFLKGNFEDMKIAFDFAGLFPAAEKT